MSCKFLKTKLAIQSGLSLESHLLLGSPSGQHEISTQFEASYENFDLLKMLGAGAFGKVYLGRDRRSNSLVAVKALRRDWIGDANAEQLFLNEAKILSSIQHPNIIKFLDAGPLPNGSWFLVLEYVNGKSLSDYVSNVKFDLYDLLSWSQQICAGLVEMHSHGLIHGDLKPSNIIVCNDGIRIIDFGFSIQKRENMQRIHGGTAAYLAPEYEASTAADVFSFGKTLAFAINKINEMSDSRLTDQLKNDRIAGL